MAGSLAESEALKVAYDYLISSIDVSSLLPAALSSHLISDRQRSESASEPDTYKKAEKFLGHLQRAVNGDSNKYYTFIQVLERTGQSRIASFLRDQVLEIRKSSDPVNPGVAMNSLGLKVSMRITNIGAHGYPGTGKTSLLDLAMGKDPAPARNSTGCVDPPSYYLVVKSEDSDGVKWKHVTTDEMIEMVCGAIKKLLEDDSNRIARREYETDDDEQRTLEDILAIQTAQDDTDFYFLFSELLEKLRNSKSSGVIFDSHWMMVTDCGGQPPFLDAAALFIRNSCLQIIPIKLDKPLDEEPEFSYFIGDESISLPLPKVHLTNQEVVETLAKTVYAIQPPYTPSSSKERMRPKFTIVGTFKDVYEDQCRKGECKEFIHQKESTLKEVLEKYESVQVCGWKGEVILPVNAVTNDEEERKVSASKLRQLIDRSKTTMKVDIELWWFGLFLSILKTADKQKKAVLTIDECYKLGKDLFRAELKKHKDFESFLYKVKSETKRALQFLHDIGLIMYFDTPALQNVVIVDMEAVFEKVSHLISVPFIRDDLFQKHYEISLPDRMQKPLQQHGLFNRSNLNSFNFNKGITVDLFLSILEHVKAVVAINKTTEYFMPCALPYATEEQCGMPCSSPPWVIRFRIKQGIAIEYIPPPVGYLPALVVFLLTRYPFHFCIDSASRQYRNQFQLVYSADGGIVYITERYPQLEIFYTLSNKLPQVCLIIRDCVLNAMSLTEDRLGLSKCRCKHELECGCDGVIDKIDSFLCLCEKGGARHLCTYNHQSKIVECVKTKTDQPLKPCHLCWIQARHKLACGLNQNNEAIQRALDIDGISCNLMQHRFLHEHWALLAVGLKLAVNIFKFQDNDDFYQLKKVIEFWVCSDSLWSWEKLVKAIIFCKQKRVAKSLADAMNVSFSVCTSEPIASLHNAEGSLAPLLDTNNAAYLLVGYDFPLQKWNELAIALNIVEKETECNQTHDSFICRLVSLLNRWINTVDCEVPWVKLAEAVEMCGEKEVADNLLKAVTLAGDGMSTGATGVTSSPHHQSSTVSAPVNTQQQLPAEQTDGSELSTHNQPPSPPLTDDTVTSAVCSMNKLVGGEGNVTAGGTQEKQLGKEPTHAIPSTQKPEEEVKKGWCKQPLFCLKAVVIIVLLVLGLFVVCSVLLLWSYLTYHNYHDTIESSSSTTFSSSSSSSFSCLPAETPILSLTLEEIILELPIITDPVGFGIRLGLKYARCQQLIKGHVGDIAGQVRSIVAAWYDQTPNRTWNKVVDALYKHGLVGYALELAKRKGVTLPQSYYRDGDHHEL